MQVAWEAVGKAGATSESIYKRLNRRIKAAIGRLEPDRVDVVVVSAGVNDIIQGRGPDAFASDLERLLRFLREQCPNAITVMLGRPPIEKFPLLPFPLNHVMFWRAGHFFSRAREVIGRLHREEQTGHKQAGDGERSEEASASDPEPRRGAYYLPCRHDIPLQDGETMADIMADDGFHPNTPVLRTLAADLVNGVISEGRWQAMLQDRLKG